MHVYQHATTPCKQSQGVPERRLIGNHGSIQASITSLSGIVATRDENGWKEGILAFPVNVRQCLCGEREDQRDQLCKYERQRFSCLRKNERLRIFWGRYDRPYIVSTLSTMWHIAGESA